jgi:hypothetical protein
LRLEKIGLPKPFQSRSIKEFTTAEFPLGTLLEEYQPIFAPGDRQSPLFEPALVLEVSAETFADGRNAYANNGIPSRIKVAGPPQGMDRNLPLLRRAAFGIRGKELEDPTQAGRSPKVGAVENPMQQIFLRLQHLRSKCATTHSLRRMSSSWQLHSFRCSLTYLDYQTVLELPSPEAFYPVYSGTLVAVYSPVVVYLHW